MAKEIERKFLVKTNDFKHKAKSVFIEQGFLSNDIERTIRVRRIGDEAYLTIKGRTIGATRQEFEYKIPLDEAEILLQDFCNHNTIKKNRYYFTHKEMLWEIDEFMEENEGLIVAEIELKHEEQAFEKPEWIGKEVTDDFRYYNVNLASKSFKKW